MHLYVVRVHCLNLSIVGATAATAAADDEDILEISGIVIRRSVVIEFDEKLLPKRKEIE